MKMDFKIFYFIYLLNIIFCDTEKLNSIENLLNWAKKKENIYKSIIKIKSNKWRT